MNLLHLSRITASIVYLESERDKSCEPLFYFLGPSWTFTSRHHDYNRAFFKVTHMDLTNHTIGFTIDGASVMLGPKACMYLINQKKNVE